MYYYEITLSYKGSHYFGWQMSTDLEKPTIEGTIYKVLQKICKYQDCTISVASRTDAGVHAKGQVIKVTIPLDIESEKLLLGMNSLLPRDIRVLKCQPCSSSFNPNKDAKSKEYHYYFSTDTIHNPLFDDIVAHVPDVDIEFMQEACKLFVGVHDFYGFAKRDTNKSSTFRSIYSCEILQTQSSGFENGIYYLQIVGQGFLRYMVRYIFAALVLRGKEEIELSNISEALKKPKEEKLSSKAKSQGLHLIKIEY